MGCLMYLVGVSVVLFIAYLIFKFVNDVCGIFWAIVAILMFFGVMAE